MPETIAHLFDQRRATYAWPSKTAAERAFLISGYLRMKARGLLGRALKLAALETIDALTHELRHSGR